MPNWWGGLTQLTIYSPCEALPWFHFPPNRQSAIPDLCHLSNYIYHQIFAQFFQSFFHSSTLNLGYFSIRTVWWMANGAKFLVHPLFIYAAFHPLLTLDMLHNPKWTPWELSLTKITRYVVGQFTIACGKIIFRKDLSSELKKKQA